MASFLYYSGSIDLHYNKIIYLICLYTIVIIYVYVCFINENPKIAERKN